MDSTYMCFDKGLFFRVQMIFLISVLWLNETKSIPQGAVRDVDRLAGVVYSATKLRMSPFSATASLFA